jgi:hypothetical protein
MLLKVALYIKLDMLICKRKLVGKEPNLAKDTVSLVVMLCNDKPLFKDAKQIICLQIFDELTKQYNTIQYNCDRNTIQYCSTGDYNLRLQAVFVQQTVVEDEHDNLKLFYKNKYIQYATCTQILQVNFFFLMFM